MRSSIQNQLETFGIVGQTYKAGKEMLVLCPFHSDHDPSMSVNLADGKWYCFTESRGGTYEELIKGLRDKGFVEQQAPKPYQVKPKQMLKSWADRGFTPPILLKWGIEWDKEARAMRIPALTEDGEVEANIWRYPEGVQPKYRYDPGYPKSERLFGIWRLPNPCPRMVLVEGPLDAIWVQESDIAACAVLGSDLSPKQIALLRERGVRKAVLCFDNDLAGMNLLYKARGALRAAGMFVYQVHLPGKYKDIQEVPHEHVGTILGKAELSVRGEVIHPRFKRWTGTGEAIASSVWRKQ